MTRQYQEIFKNLNEHHEQVIKITRRHWFNILQQFAGIIGLFLLLVVALAISVTQMSSGTELTGPALAFFFTFMLMFFWIYSFFIWITYYFDVWIIAEDHIINIEQKSFFFRRVGEFKMEKIQDVTVRVDGFFQTMLGFGDVHIQTASKDEWFIFRKIPKPYEIKDLIMDLQRKGMQDRYEQFGALIKEEVGEANGATQKKA